MADSVKRSCVVCTESPPNEQDLIKPCRICAVDYCEACVVEMFTAATSNTSRMPPRCCTLLQIHTALAGLNEQQASDYRAKFEEWITIDKLYCPSPTCSTFISEWLRPAAAAGPAISLQSVLSELIKVVSGSPSARFFRGELPITELRGYTAVIQVPMDLSIIQGKVEASSYPSTTDLTADVMLIVQNAKHYNGLDHPVARTADQLLEAYMEQLSASVDGLIASHRTAAVPDQCLCPKCRIAICLRCRQIDHSGTPCDTSIADSELAMLEQFRYKRCPLCRHAVKKMYGCSHIQCHCGAHWCYYCQQSVNECDGACSARAESDDEEDDEDDEDEDELSEPDEEHGQLLLADLVDQSKPVTAEKESLPAAGSQPQASVTANLNMRHVDLDRGGTRRWGEADFDFGDEPNEDGGGDQIWACPHHFDPFKPVMDGMNRGDLGKLECNRCFAKVSHISQSSPADTTAATGIASQADQAWECEGCHVLTCLACRDLWRAVGQGT